MVDVPYDTIADIPPAEVGEVELYHPKSWWTQEGEMRQRGAPYSTSQPSAAAAARKVRQA